MELLPIVIVVSLLGFFVVLATILFTWQYCKIRESKRRRRSNTQYKPPRKLTLQSGNVIPASEAQDTASTRQCLSLDLPSPRCAYFVTCEANNGRRVSSSCSKITARDHGHPPILTEFQTQRRNAKTPSDPPLSKSSMPEVCDLPKSPNAIIAKQGSCTLPRPSLVTIQTRRPSASKSIDSQQRRLSGQSLETKDQEPKYPISSNSTMQGIHSPSPISYVSPKVLSREANDTPPNPMKLNSSVRRTGTERTIKAQHMEHTVDPRVASLSVKSGYNQRPPPLTGQTGDIAPRVRFANEVDDLNRISFLSMTDSPSSCASSEQASPVSPMVHAFAPPPSKEQLAFYQQPSVVPSELSPGAEPVAPGLSGDVPPHLATPDFGRAFFELPSTSVDGGNLQRGVSVMSNRSALTVASSEIDADWTIGSARAVSIYPSVAQQDDKSPPYAEKLRSKYGRYPKGRRDKALPDIPRSPLYQISFDSR